MMLRWRHTPSTRYWSATAINPAAGALASTRSTQLTATTTVTMECRPRQHQCQGRRRRLHCATVNPQRPRSRRQPSRAAHHVGRIWARIARSRSPGTDGRHRSVRAMTSSRVTAHVLMLAPQTTKFRSEAPFGSTYKRLWQGMDAGRRPRERPHTPQRQSRRKRHHSRLHGPATASGDRRASHDPPQQKRPLPGGEGVLH